MDKSKIAIKLSLIKNIIGNVILFMIFTLMIGHSVNTGWIQSYFPNGTLLILIASIVVYLFFKHKSSYRLNWRFFAPFLLFFIIIFLYALINGSIVEIEKLIYIYISLLLLHKSNLNSSDITKIGFTFSISSIYMASEFTNYQINTLGIIFSFGIVGLVNFIDFNLKRDKSIIYILLSIVSIIFISLTRMRGAILAITIIYTYTIAKELNTNKKRVISLFIIPIILLVTWNAISVFFGKYLFVNKWGGADFTSGRISIWKYILNNASVLGIGFDYISGYAHAHNTLMHFIGRYGFIIIPLFSLLIYKIIVTVYYIPKNKIIKNSYLRILIVWFILSITETIDFIKVPLYAPQFMLLLYFIILNRKEDLNEK